VLRDSFWLNLNFRAMRETSWPFALPFVSLSAPFAGRLPSLVESMIPKNENRLSEKITLKKSWTMILIQFDHGLVRAAYKAPRPGHML
jgi:hypothetical protein